MLRAELYRALRSRTFLLALMIGVVALAFGLYQYASFLITNPEYASINPPFFYNAYDATIWAQRSIIGLIVPMLAVLPFTDSLVLDRTSGYLRSVLTRTSYKRYLGAKFTACVLSGGLAVAVPLLLLFAYASSVFPRGLNLVEGQQRILSDPHTLGPFGALYRTAPDLYILALVALAFVFGAIYATFGLSISVFANNRYVVLATPWLVYFVVNFVVAILGLERWSPSATYAPHWLNNVGWIHLAVGLGGLFLVSSLVFWTMSPKMKERV